MLIATIAGSLVATHANASDSVDARARFNNEYGTASQKLKEAGGSVCFEEVQTNVRDNGNETTEVIYRSNGESLLYRLREKKNDGMREYVIVATPKRTFYLSKPAKQDNFVLKNLAGESEYDHAVTVIRLNARLAFLPYCYLEMPIVDFLKQPDVSVVDVSETDHAGARAVRVSWQRPRRMPDGREYEELGWFLLSPDDTWALREYEVGAKGYPSRIRGVVRYGERKDNVPVASEFESWKEKDEKRSAVFSVRASKVQLTPAKPAEFTLRAFGLPEVGEVVASSGQSMLKYWLLGLGALSGVIAASLRWYVYRKQLQ